MAGMTNDTRRSNTSCGTALQDARVAPDRRIAAAGADSKLASEVGMSTVLSMLVVVLGGGLVMLVATLFLTGLAQERIIPMVQLRIEQAVSGEPAESAPDSLESVEEAESSLPPADALAAHIEALGALNGLQARTARAASQVASQIHPRRLAKLSMEGIAASEIAALTDPPPEPDTP